MKALFYGILAAFGALALESLFFIFPQISPEGNIPIWFMPLGVFVEELLSLVMLVSLFHSSSERDNFFAAALIFGTGFSLPEIFLNALSDPSFEPNALLSFLSLLLLHSATAGIIGAYLSGKDTAGPGIVLFFFAALLIHLTFNFLVLADTSLWVIISLPVGTIAFCLIILKIFAALNSLPRRTN